MCGEDICEDGELLCRRPFLCKSRLHFSSAPYEISIISCSGSNFYLITVAFFSSGGGVFEGNVKSCIALIICCS